MNDANHNHRANGTANGGGHGPAPPPRRDPLTTDAWLVGGGIASLAAAVHLITDAGVPANRVHILEAGPTPGGSMAAEPGSAGVRRGYVIRAARKLNFSYRCLYDTLSRIPYNPPKEPPRTPTSASELKPEPEPEPEPESESEPTSTSASSNTELKQGHKQEQDPADPAQPEDDATSDCTLIDHPPTTPKTLRDYIRGHPCKTQDRARTRVRLVCLSPAGHPETVDTATMGLDPRDQAALMAFILRSEDSLGYATIQGFFDNGFFETNFWDMFSTMYLFKPWHSAVEFRRYLHRFLHEVPNISSMAGMEYMPVNDFDAAIVPMVEFLKREGVDFQYDTTALSLDFAPDSREILVSSLLTKRGTTNHTIPVKPTDIVLITLGSMTSSSHQGTNTTPPPPLPKDSWVRQHPDPIWRLWTDLASPSLNPHHSSKFGDPRFFRENQGESMGLAFTTTLFESSFIDHLLSWAGSTHGTCPLLSFRDCPWLLSVTVPRQPYFADQAEGTTVFWGYGLYPDQPGRFVRKPMTECSGREILTELLGLMAFPLQPTLDESITLPVLMPLITSPYLARREGSRPRVVPEGSGNLGLMGQYVEMERDVTFTMEYSVRSAQVAVYDLMGLERRPPEVYGENPPAAVLGEALKTLMI